MASNLQHKNIVSFHSTLRNFLVYGNVLKQVIVLEVREGKRHKNPSYELCLDYSTRKSARRGTNDNAVRHEIIRQATSNTENSNETSAVVPTRGKWLYGNWFYREQRASTRLYLSNKNISDSVKMQKHIMQLGVRPVFELRRHSLRLFVTRLSDLWSSFYDIMIY
jgi:hypothetical protein